MFFFKPSPVSWIAVFLGNPGLKFEATRHNAGFMTADIISEGLGTKIDRIKFSSLSAIAKLGGNSLLLLKPQTYMNLSGSAVKSAARYYKVPLERVIVIADDVSLPLSTIRIRRNGSAGGHNGMKDIIKAFKSENFPRIRIGVGAPPHKDYDIKDWVLAKLTASEFKSLNDSCQNAAAALEMILSSGIDKAMAEFN